MDSEQHEHDDYDGFRVFAGLGNAFLIATGIGLTVWLVLKLFF